jgi:hypothetical protein
MILERQNVVVFDEIAHSYKNTKTGLFMLPGSKIKEKVKIPFDDKGTALRMAHGDVSVQQDILRQWAYKRDTANERGNKIHKFIESLIPLLKESEATILIAIEKYGSEFDYKIKKAVTEIIFYLREYHSCLSEVLVYSENYNVAGTADLLSLRQNSKSSVIDIDDYKTNFISFDSVKRTSDDIKHYNRFYLPPFDYIEDCKYNDYVFQLSIYAVLVEETYKRKIGKLTLHDINPDGVYTRLPVPYWRMEAITLLEHIKKLKILPALPSGNGQPITTEVDEW